MLPILSVLPCKHVSQLFQMSGTYTSMVLVGSDARKSGAAVYSVASQVGHALSQDAYIRNLPELVVISTPRPPLDLQI